MHSTLLTVSLALRDHKLCSKHTPPLEAAQRIATLTGHSSKVTASAFSHGSPCRLLCTASDDAVLLWGLADGSCARLLDAPPDTPHHIAFNPTNQFLALCVGSLIYIASPSDSTITCVLEGHAGMVTSAAFGLAHPAFLVSADDDRRFKVWDVARKSLLFQSQYETPAPFTAACFDTEGYRLFLGASDGSLHVFQLEPTGVCRRIATVDCKRLATKLLQTATLARTAATGPTPAPPPVPAMAPGLQPQQRRHVPGRWGLTREATAEEAVDTFGVASTQTAAPTVVSSETSAPALAAWKRSQSTASHEGGAVTVADGVGRVGNESNSKGSVGGVSGGLECQGVSDDLLDDDMTILAIGRIMYDDAAPLQQQQQQQRGHGVDDEQQRSSRAMQEYLQMVGGATHDSVHTASSSVLGSLQAQRTRMAIATSQALVLLNGHTFKGAGVYRWAREEDWTSYPPASQATLPASIASCHLSSARVSCETCGIDVTLASVAGAFQRAVHTIALSRRATPLVAGVGDGGGSGDEGTATAAQCSLSVQATAPLESNSPLHAVLQPKPPASKKSKSAGRRPKKLPSGRRATRTDQAVTFRTSIKSSGEEAATLILGGGRGEAELTAWDVSRYPLDGPPPSRLIDTKPLTATTHTCGAVGLALNQEGTGVCAWLSDRTVHALPSRLSSEKPSRVGVAHNATVTRASWSLDGRWILSAAADEHPIVWNPDKIERRVDADPPVAVLRMSTLRHNFKQKAQDTTPNPPMTKLRDAQFYYMDRFILTAHGTDVCMYKYHLDPTVDDIKRYVNKSKYKMVVSLRNRQAHALTCLSAVNSFHSHIVLAAASDRSISIFDMNRATLAHTIQRAHSRSIYRIAQHHGSPVVSHPPDAYNLFLTGALSDGIALWDIRANECVRACVSHTSRAVPVGFEFSPCGRFVMCGSEDKAAYVYDIRQGLLLNKLGSHLDVVTDVAHHPLKPVVFTSCMDGRLRVFGPP
ncbi:hypothetical protein PTSG_08077 [Salpingoeca rosetta]|uniref:Uncharacterized protein n=1 Tax=Salpingoeca rosetta (strain ATCC 50818 / BSB-021) TaxID=946362 RepID=F2UHX7_SALR5|nr:uncharacterized protein PTSG_08077 [Salpingoeca rosetta]EGD76726.1 hypothetical protein PTSG_08077 [Salpingoeca rosetta]|eukprot:XP_004991098.1 hypothetical protein PTSG_08077 [Salpingoeca rosetta]